LRKEETVLYLTLGHSSTAYLDIASQPADKLQGEVGRGVQPKGTGMWSRSPTTTSYGYAVYSHSVI